MGDKFGYWASALIALIGVIASVGVSYWVTYEKIEKPKIEMETRRNAIATIQAIQEIRPSADIKCFSVEIDRSFSWKIACNVTNSGKYLARYTVTDLSVGLFDDKKQREYKEIDGGFTRLTKDRWAAIALKPGESTNFNETIDFDRSKYPNGVDSGRIVARISFVLSAWDKIVWHMREVFPDFLDLIEDVKFSGRDFYVRLNELDTAR